MLDMIPSNRRLLMDVDKRALLAAVNDLISEPAPQFKVDAIEAISPLRNEMSKIHC